MEALKVHVGSRLAGLGSALRGAPARKSLTNKRLDGMHRVWVNGGHMEKRGRRRGMRG